MVPTPSHHSHQVLAVLRLPQQEVVAFGGMKSQKKNSSRYPEDQSTFVYAPFRKGGASSFSLSDPLNVDDALDAIPGWLDQLSSESVESTTRDDYNRAAKSLLDQLRNGLLRKVVLSRVINLPLPAHFDFTKCFHQLCETYPSAAVHLLAIEGKEIWLGASPECLIDFDHGQLQTVSLAGTQPIGHRELHEIEWSSKEKEEQQLVTDYIEKVLLLHDDISQVDRQDPETVAAGNVAHLKTAFSANTNPGFDWLRLVQQLHPTPAICGWPRAEALKAIEQNEAHRRLYYGGFFGTAQQDRGQLYLNLRCMRITKNSLQLFVGGGYTASSDIDAEWEETEHKAQTLLSVIENLRKFESS